MSLKVRKLDVAAFILARNTERELDRSDALTTFDDLLDLNWCS